MKRGKKYTETFKRHKCDAHQYSYKTPGSRKSKVKNLKDSKSYARKSDNEKSDVGKIVAIKPGGENVT